MYSIEELQKIAKDVRRDVIEMVWRAGSGHLAGSLSCTDILVALWFGEIIARGNRGDQGDRGTCLPAGRDRFILSAGHYCPALYNVLSRLGYFDRKLLWTLRDLGSPLQGHPHRGNLPGIELSTGALGQGLSVGVGKALALRLSARGQSFSEPDFPLSTLHSPLVFVLMSDGEQNEGQVWEAAMTAAKYKLDNLIAIIDRNGIQSVGMTKDIMPLEDLREKYETFGWEAAMVDGHEIGEMIRVMTRLRSSSYGGQRGRPTVSAEALTQSGRRPKVVIAKTVAGRGVSFLEGDFRWHARPIGEEEYKKALEELA